MVDVLKIYKAIKQGLTSKEAKQLAEKFRRETTDAGKFLKSRVDARDKKIKESASKFVKRRKQLAGAKGAAGKMARRTGPSKKEVVGYGTAAGTGLLASSQIKKRRKKGEK